MEKERTSSLLEGRRNVDKTRFKLMIGPRGNDRKIGKIIGAHVTRGRRMEVSEEEEEAIRCWKR